MITGCNEELRRPGACGAVLVQPLPRDWGIGGAPQAKESRLSCTAELVERLQIIPSELLKGGVHEHTNKCNKTIFLSKKILTKRSNLAGNLIEPNLGQANTF